MYGPTGGPGGGSSAGGGAPEATKKLTVPELRARKGRERVAMVTAYDYTMGRLMDESGVDVLLVGDSLGMVVQGHTTTLPVTLDEIAYHTRAVVRAARRAHVVADMPFMSFQVSPDQAVESAGKLMKDGHAESVKLEGGREFAEHVRRICRAGVPVMGHVGLTPQAVHALGGFKVQGKGSEAAERVYEDAIALDEAGAYAIVLEAMPPDLAAAITESVSAITIGIGAGAGCDGQVLVSYDLLGMYRDMKPPKFVKRFGELGEAIVGATRAYVSEVQAGTFPGPDHSFRPNGFLRRDRTEEPREELPPHWQTH